VIAVERHQERTPSPVREERAIVLDFLPHGYPFDRRPSHKKTPVIQAIGKNKFTLLELIPKKGVTVKLMQEVYIGEGERQEIHHIQGRVAMGKLTGTAKQELEFVVKDIVSKAQAPFVAFFNKAQPLSTRMHQLELLPGLGKKHMWEIINSREEKDFESFADIKARVKLIPNPEKVIVKRILSELEGKEKYSIFVDRG
jgi:putative nucleotide binding protein